MIYRRPDFMVIGQKGFTLLEVLVAFTILSIVLVPLINSFSIAGRINADTIRLGTALSTAESKMEEILKRPFREIADIPERDFSAEEAYAEYQGFMYSVVVNEGSPLLKTITVRVVYQDAGGNEQEVVIIRDKARR